VSNDLEDELRRALRPVDPGEDFTARVLARVASGVPAARSMPRRFLWAPVALAASLAAAAVIRHEWLERREMEGLQARQQLIEALRVTSQKLDLAYRIVNSPPPSGSDDKSGA
jgi:hypothetical protein